MSSFFRIFFASLLALLVFCVLGVFIFIGLLSGITSRDPVSTGSKAVLVVDLSQPYPEIKEDNPFLGFGSEEHYNVPSLYDVIRLINKAKQDSSVKGIYIKCGGNANGFASNDEIRTAIADFKTSNKFVYAYGDIISQGAYQVASVADKVYCNPRGGIDWRGFAMQMVFLKGALDKLEIQPQIFYAGKFKSATEPFRATEMTEPNRIQSSALLNDLYIHFLSQVSASRKIDTTLLRQYANENSLQFPQDAVRLGMLDGVRYDDEVKNEIVSKVGAASIDKLNFLSLGKYAEAVTYKQRGTDRIAVIYAQGDIIDGTGDRGQIGGDTYRNHIRKARLDKNIKAIVLRVNSGGGSALASENIWRELMLAKKEKPLVVSFGDVAASGGYYIGCAGDSIFAQPNTITGSIGVFSIIPNMQGFFNDKLGVTFDAVTTGPNADALTVTKPLSEPQKRFIQNDIDSIYFTFKSRVAQGRKLDMAMVDSIGQGRVWSGNRAIEINLVDRIGTLQDAINAASKMAKLKEYSLREYPEPQNMFEEFSRFFGSQKENSKNSMVKEEVGETGAKAYSSLKKLKAMIGVSQARIPFEYSIY